MNMISGLIDQRFTGDINIFPDYGFASLGKILRMLDRDEMQELFRAGERATWPQVPMIETTTRIGRCLDGILRDFEAREEEWLDATTAGSTASAAKAAMKKRKPQAAHQRPRNRAAG
jgi:hypothetical protein